MNGNFHQSISDMSVIPIDTESSRLLEESDSNRRCLAYFGDLWRRIRMEFVVEFPMFKDRWKTILFGILFQYVHGIFTQLEKRLHEPQVNPLPDLGFQVLRELGEENAWVSESIFYAMFASFLLWIISPFLINRKKFYTVVLISRLLTVLATCQALRILSFLSTQLPAPNYHCRAGEKTAKLEWPNHEYEHFIFNPVQQAAYGCGDLIFSSHTTFILVGVLTYTTYGSFFVMKIVAWIFATILSLLIIASRKHYTVDVVVAWYTVPLVFYTYHRRWTTKRDMGDNALDVDGRNASDDDEVSVDLERQGQNGKELMKTSSAKSPKHSVSLLDLYSMEAGYMNGSQKGNAREQFKPIHLQMIKTRSASRLDDI